MPSSGMLLCVCLLVEPMCIPAAANPAAAAQHGCRPWQRGTARSRRWGAGASRERVPKCCPVPSQPVASSTGCAVLPAHPVHAQAPPVHVHEPQCMPSCPKPWHPPLACLYPPNMPWHPPGLPWPPHTPNMPWQPAHIAAGHAARAGCAGVLRGMQVCSKVCPCAPGHGLGWG